MKMLTSAAAKPQSVVGIQRVHYRQTFTITEKHESSVYSFILNISQNLKGAKTKTGNQQTALNPSVHSLQND